MDMKKEVFRHNILCNPKVVGRRACCQNYFDLAWLSWRRTGQAWVPPCGTSSSWVVLTCHHSRATDPDGLPWYQVRWGSWSRVLWWAFWRHLHTAHLTKSHRPFNTFPGPGTPVGKDRSLAKCQCRKPKLICTIYFLRHSFSVNNYPWQQSKS